MRRSARFSIALIGMILASLIGVGSVNAASSEESEFMSKANAERSSRGIHRLTWRDDLASVARRHSRRMAEQNSLYHNPNLRDEVSDWEVVGENVGYGPSVDNLHQAFMDSPGHRRNILDQEYTHIGVGTVWDHGVLWVTQVFMRPRDRASSGSGSGYSSGSGSQPRAKARTTSGGSRRRSTGTTDRPQPQPALPPRRTPVAPVVPAPVPASGDELTRLMVRNVLGGDHPAVGRIEDPALSLPASAEAGLVPITFRPFTQIAAQVSRQLLTGSPAPAAKK